MCESCVAAAFDEHLHRERLPRGVGRPPAFVRRAASARARSRDRRRRDRASPASTCVLQVGGDLEDVQQVRRQVRRRAPAVARPVGEAAAVALEAFELAQRRLHGRA